MSEIDKVRAMRYDVIALGVLVLFTVGVKGIGMDIREIWIRPLSLRFEEEGESIGSNVDTVQDGVVDACMFSACVCMI